LLSLYGDAANSEVITHAGLARACVLVVTVSDDSTAELVVASAQDINPEIPFITRVASEEGMLILVKLGVRNIILPELEGCLEIVHHTLLELGFPLRKIHEYTEAVRRDRNIFNIHTGEEQRILSDLLRASELIDINWIILDQASPLIG
jgi:monovalent cation:H+ antiporter-2, CPA2 family